MRFCPGCGLNTTAAAGTGDEPLTVPEGRPLDAPRPSPRSFGDRAPRIPAVVIAGLLILVGLIAYGVLTRAPGDLAPGGGSGGAGGQPGGSANPSAPIVGLTIVSPTDGQAVATKDVNVIGTAPPGVSITQDVSFGLDQHATSDGTGQWTIKVGLKEGENKLVFRIGDDQSTRKEIRITYTPQKP
jgi:hypothetical protein